MLPTHSEKLSFDNIAWGEASVRAGGSNGVLSRQLGPDEQHALLTAEFLALLIVAHSAAGAGALLGEEIGTNEKRRHLP